MVKRLGAVAVAIAAAVFILSGCSGGQAPSSSSAPDAAGAGSVKLAIIHTNDTHGYDLSTDASLGMAAVSQLKADYEAQGYETLLFDAGDALQGNILSDDSEGAVISDFMNACKYDAMALGNHEFDYGADVLQQRMESMDFPVLCANITVDATGELFAQPNATFTLSDGTKLGVFGLDTAETMTKSATKNTRGLTFAQGDDLYACAQQQIDELRAQGCDLVVCLGHLGELESSQPNRASDVVANTEGIDLFIDGHDHLTENVVMKDKGGNDVLVVETGCYLANIGVVTYEDGAFSEKLVAVGEYSGRDDLVGMQVESVSDDIDKRLGHTVGASSFELDGGRNPGVRDHETTLGDFAADAVRWEATQALGSEPDVVILNGGSIRASLGPGDITMRDLQSAMPYPNQVCTIQVTGAELLEALEAATQGSPEEMGAFPQVSGITFTLDVTVPYEKGELYPYSTYYAPANPGARVKIADVNGKPFDPQATYVVATTDFVSTGGDAYYCFVAADAAGVQTTGYTAYECLQHYLAGECGGVVPDEYAQVQGRVTVIGA